MERSVLKLEIKSWEKQFKAREGRNPTRDDIKKNLDVAAKYKLYNSLKQQCNRQPLSPVKRQRQSHNGQLQTPEKTSPDAPRRSQDADTGISPRVEQLGPTPQLNGRVMSIFDVITSPYRTPTKCRTVNVLSTPSRRLDLESTLQEETGGDEVETKTPQKVVRTLTFETPAYLKNRAVEMVSSSPSPLATQRMKKSLSTIASELKDIQDELKYGDYDEDDLIPFAEHDSSDDEAGEEDEQGSVPLQQWKKKGPKRQVRLVKKRARKTTGNEDEMKGKNLREEMQKLATVKESTFESENSEEWSDNDSEYDNDDYVIPEVTSKRRKPLNNNFKKYKIQKRKNIFGRRQRGW
ncbi:Sld2p CYBJADRAFT_167628 [Cyberlindnera jadinii NRRL Y-1542]|uniref:DNA replication regulator SLD2 n=1 Tax=Cyberlindnera jadinii (strain ATCC 18201 / CBS 1600 / BCRC 20928 / JCM 3617 / NBRC 0987 / NRRL Y-1542) TaxID=983966 RepID=A0A1E4S275_CYBJN|nr:hypothetical protein CYBJADRAFT_167628 [Cyberlindnera jadinii NRRL Y-1542]ODV73598.1 hypothetical protein CYBJADRAFT_167628 [Cyberlindnera jadinii NRRL Y-1542]